jgi:hypothetical protein
MTAPLLETREQAIHWLNRSGLKAREHNGWLGEAIAISRPLPSNPGGGSSEDTLMLYPSGTGWTVGRSLPGRRGLGRAFPSLNEAARYVAEALKASPA